MKRLLQIGAGLLVAAVVFATLGPPRYRPMTDLGQDGEHALAFVLVGLAVGVAFDRRPWLTAAIAIVLTGVLELLQFFAPGRHARLEDFVVNALTLCVGLVVAAGVQFLLHRLRSPSHATDV